MARLKAAEIVYRNNKTVYESVAMTTPKGANFLSLLPDHHAVIAKVGQVAMPMPNLQALGRMFCEEIRWCGALYSVDRIDHDPDCVQGWMEMQQLDNAGELLQFPMLYFCLTK